MVALGVGTLATVLRAGADIADYENFLLLIGSVFVPLLGVLVVDYFLVSRRSGTSASTHRLGGPCWCPGCWASSPTSSSTPARSGWWAHWARVAGWLHFTPTVWMSASIISFAVAALA